MVTAIRSVVTPFSVSHAAQLAAIASIQAQQELLARVEATVSERARVATALAEQGWTIPEAQA